MMSTLTLCLRLLAHVWRGQRIIRRNFSQYSQAQRHEAIRSWSQSMLAMVGIELCVIDQRGDAALREDQGALHVCNHISWLDIFVMNAWQASTFVSKHEIARWPVIGPLVTGAGTLYIERAKRRDAHKLVGVMADALRQGKRVTIFPEGTTSDGTGLLHFHANLLQSAVDSRSSVQPLALRYLDAKTRERTLVPAYIDDMNLLQSLARMAAYNKAKPGSHIVAEITLLPAQRGDDRRKLSASLRESMAHALGVNETDPVDMANPHSNVTT
jgi:1-acyl-sn-glycerol-3-phosphate acyltransferase